jgi:hypothetical protein
LERAKGFKPCAENSQSVDTTIGSESPNSQGARGRAQENGPNRCSSEIVGIQTASLDDAFQGANRDRFAPVDCENHLPPVFVPPLLVAAPLRDDAESVLPQNSGDILSCANREPLAHGKESSTSFAPLVNSTGEGSNQSSSASRAFAMASASESPADAQPGNSGNTADQRLAAGSNSTTARNFIHQKDTESRSGQQEHIEKAANSAADEILTKHKDLFRIVSAWEDLPVPLKAMRTPLRYTLATFLQRNGVSLRVAMQEMRHSDSKLTMQVYTESQLPTFEKLQSLPALFECAHGRAQISGADGQNGSQPVAPKEMERSLRPLQIRAPVAL